MSLTRQFITTPGSTAAVRTSVTGGRIEASADYYPYGTPFASRLMAVFMVIMYIMATPARASGQQTDNLFSDMIAETMARTYECCKSWESS